MTTMRFDIQLRCYFGIPPSCELKHLKLKEQQKNERKIVSKQRQQAGKQSKADKKNNQDVKLIEVVQCSVRDCSSPCPGDLDVAYFVTHAAGKLSRLIDYQQEEIKSQNARRGWERGNSSGKSQTTDHVTSRTLRIWIAQGSLDRKSWQGGKDGRFAEVGSELAIWKAMRSFLFMFVAAFGKSLRAC